MKILKEKNQILKTSSKTPFIKGGMGDLIKITLTSLVAALACTGVIYAATTVGTNISTTGTLDVTGVSTLTGNTSIAGTLGVTGLITVVNASSTLLSVSSTAYIGGTSGLILSDGSITAASGAISFGNENLTTTGNIGIGTSSPYAKLSVVGEIVGSYITATSTTATSTFAGGLNVGSGGLVYDFSSGKIGIGVSTPANEHASGKLKILDSVTDVGHGWNTLSTSNTTGESGSLEIRGSQTVTSLNTTTGTRGRLLGIYPTVTIDGSVLLNPVSSGLDGINLKYFRTGASDFGQHGVMYGQIIALGHDSNNDVGTGGIKGYAVTPFLGGGSTHAWYSIEIDRDHAPHDNDANAKSVTQIGKCRLEDDSANFGADCFQDDGTRLTANASYDTFAECDAAGYNWVTYQTKNRCEATAVCTDVEGDASSGACTGLTPAGIWMDKTANAGEGAHYWLPQPRFSAYWKDELMTSLMRGKSFLFGKYDPELTNNDRKQVMFGIKDEITNYTARSCDTGSWLTKAVCENNSQVWKEGRVYSTDTAPGSDTINVVNYTNLNGEFIWLMCEVTATGFRYIEKVTIDATSGTNQGTSDAIVVDIDALGSGCYDADNAGGTSTTITISETAGNDTLAVAADFTDSNVSKATLDIPAYPYVMYCSGDAGQSDNFASSGTGGFDLTLGNCDFNSYRSGVGIRFGEAIDTAVMDDDDIASGKPHALAIPDQFGGIRQLTNNLAFLDTAYTGGSLGTYGTLNTYVQRYYTARPTIFEVKNAGGTSFIDLENDGDLRIAKTGAGKLAVGLHTVSDASVIAGSVIGTNVYSDSMTTSAGGFYHTKEYSHIFKMITAGSGTDWLLNVGSSGNVVMDPDRNFGISFQTSTSGLVDSDATDTFTMRNGTPPNDNTGILNKAHLFVKDADGVAGAATWHQFSEDTPDNTMQIIMSYYIDATVDTIANRKTNWSPQREGVCVSFEGASDTPTYACYLNGGWRDFATW